MDTSDKIITKRHKVKQDNNTIFDDVFRTMVEKMPRFLIALTNYVFKTNYPYTEKVIQMRNEHHVFDDTHITDCFVQIKNRLFHFECQSRNDSAMGKRILQYKFENAIDSAKSKPVKNNIIQTSATLPSSCVIYLRCTKSTPNGYLTVISNHKNEKLCQEEACVIIPKLSLEEILKHDLLMFLPYYIMRYEKKLNSRNAKTRKEVLHSLETECTIINKALQDEEIQKRLDFSYVDMIDLIVKISDYIIKNSHNMDSFKERAIDMRGKILKLPTEIIAEEEAKSFLIFNTMIESGSITKEGALAAMPDDTKKKFLKWRETHNK